MTNPLFGLMVVTTGINPSHRAKTPAHQPDGWTVEILRGVHLKLEASKRNPQLTRHKRTSKPTHRSAHIHLATTPLSKLMLPYLFEIPILHSRPFG